MIGYIRKVSEAKWSLVYQNFRLYLFQRFYLKKLSNKCITRLFERFEIQIKSHCKGTKTNCFRSLKPLQHGHLTCPDWRRKNQTKPNQSVEVVIASLLLSSFPPESFKYILSPCLIFSPSWYSLSVLSQLVIFSYISAWSFWDFSQRKTQISVEGKKKEKTSIINLEEPWNHTSQEVWCSLENPLGINHRSIMQVCVCVCVCVRVRVCVPSPMAAAQHRNGYWSLFITKPMCLNSGDCI